MAWVLVSQNRQRVFELSLSNLTVGSQVSTCWSMVDEIVLVYEAKGTGVIPRREVDLGEEKGIVRIVCNYV